MPAAGGRTIGYEDESLLEVGLRRPLRRIEGIFPDTADAVDVATAVLDAVLARRFWILTHPESREMAVVRVRRAAVGLNPRFGATDLD